MISEKRSRHSCPAGAMPRTLMWSFCEYFELNEHLIAFYCFTCSTSEKLRAQKSSFTPMFAIKYATRRHFCIHHNKSHQLKARYMYWPMNGATNAATPSLHTFHCMFFAPPAAPPLGQRKIEIVERMEERDFIAHFNFIKIIIWRVRVLFFSIHRNSWKRAHSVNRAILAKRRQTFCYDNEFYDKWFHFIFRQIWWWVDLFVRNARTSLDF